MLYVCNLLEMPTHAAALEPSHVMSLVPAGEQPSTPLGVDPQQHLRLAIDDISEPLPGYVLPSEADVRRIIEFARAWPARRPMLVHCVAGISRSMAAALITLLVKAPGQEVAATRQMRAAAPHAQPNRRIVALADDLLDCGGRLRTALRVMGAGSGALAGPLVRLPLLQAGDDTPVRQRRASTSAA